MADALNIAISGLLASRRLLDTTSHNIANVNTEGYSRQRVELGTRPPQYTGAGYFGNGVTFQDVTRLYDGFLTSQVRSSASLHSQLDTYYDLARRVDNVVADADAGVISALNDFFDAVQDVANEPTSMPAREVLLGGAEALSSRFNAVHERIGSLRDSINLDITAAVAEINSLATNIARLNRDIIGSGASGTGRWPNDLLDQRDLLIDKLSELVSVSTVAQDDGSVNVFVGTGQSLVVGTNAQQLATMVNPYDPQRVEVGYGAGATGVVITGQLSGGRLGGLQAFRDELLDPALSRLGRVAVGLAETFNDQHRLGQDLQGALGEDFFAVAAPAVLSHADNGSGTVSASVSDVNALVATDYRLDRNGAAYTLVRQSDGEVFDLAALGFPGASVTVDGLSLTDAGIADGDSFLIRPTHGAAGSLAVAIAGADRVAAATPLRTGADLANTGSGQIAAGAVTNTSNLPLAGDITLQFDPVDNGTGVPGFIVTGGPGGALDYDPASEGAGKDFTFPGYGGFSFTVSGTPAAGDSFVISANADGVGDNRNALLLAGLRSTATFAGTAATYQEAYGELVGYVGTRTRQADVNRQAQSSLLDQATRDREAVSGVNLDEEAANLMRFQQAYQAAAQVVGAVNDMFQELISAVRR